MAADGATEARVRWMLVGNLGGADVSGVTPDGFAEALAKAGLGGEVTVADRLGAADKRTYKVYFPRLKSFSMAEIVATTEPLASLRALAEALASGDAARRPSTDDAIEKVKELVGPGELLGEIEAALRPPAPAAAGGSNSGAGNGTGAAAKTGGGGDGIFGQADLPGGGRVDGTSEARGAVDSFVKSIRGPGASKSATGFSAARDVLERAVFASAADILANPGVQQMESIWRGVKLVVDNCPGGSSMLVDLVNRPVTDATALLRAQGEREPFDRVDAVFLLETFDDPALLAELATTAEDVNVPVVVDVSSAAWAKACVETALKGDEVQAAPEAWTALRTAEESRWLSATVNRVVLANDGTGTNRRTVLGSPAAALAAMLASSYRYTAGFGRVFGNDGALRGGGLLEIASGPQRGTMVPVETFIPLRAQNDLAKLGLLAMGSGRNSDKVILSAAPTARQSADAVPLPAQVLTGRVVRFSQWVRDQIPPGTTDADVKTMFKQAAEFFLLSGMQGAELRAELIQDKGGLPSVLVAVNVPAPLAGTPFEMAFALPLRQA